MATLKKFKQKVHLIFGSERRRLPNKERMFIEKILREHGFSEDDTSEERFQAAVIIAHTIRALNDVRITCGNRELIFILDNGRATASSD